VEQHELHQRANILHNKVMTPLDLQPEELAAEWEVEWEAVWEAIDKLRIVGMKLAEHKCRKQKMEAIQRIPELSDIS
jgi:biotin operon repressor